MKGTHLTLPALPTKLTDMSTPHYEVTLPICKKKVSYRPFSVKEQMVLLQALESGDSSAMIKSMDTCNQACSEITADQHLAVCDALYLFIQIRSKSAGEVVSPMFKCPKCEEEQEVAIPLAEIQIVIPPEHQHKIELINNTGIVLRDPAFADVVEFGAEKILMDVDTQLALTSRCIEHIWADDEVYATKDYDPASVLEFVLNIPGEQFQKVMDFFDSAPHLEYKTTFKCGKCEHEEALTVRKLEDFFG